MYTLLKASRGSVLLSCMHACSQDSEATPPSLVSQVWENTSFQLTAPEDTLGSTLILGVTHLTLGPMGSVSTAQMRHKPAEKTRGQLGSPLLNWGHRGLPMPSGPQVASGKVVHLER